MSLCLKCKVNKATVHFVREVDGKEKVNVQLCEDCARPVMIRQEASWQGSKKCAFCGGAAFSPLPAVHNVTYACCGCRADYARIFFELCSEQHPDLVLRSKGDIFFFDMCFDLEVEQWADVAGHQAMEQLRLRTEDACDPKANRVDGRIDLPAPHTT
jgi:hypothetical protein